MPVPEMTHAGEPQPAQQRRGPGPVLFATALMSLVLTSQAGAADDPAEAACHQKDTTIAIMECLGAVTAQWDKRLNGAYQAALKASESDVRRKALIRAERAWIAYRDADCGWYGAQEGTIREVAGAQCMLDLTRSRAMELRDALQP